jgi:hypothetical protein
MLLILEFTLLFLFRCFHLLPHPLGLVTCGMGAYVAIYFGALTQSTEAIVARRSLGISRTSQAYRFRFIAYLIASSTIYRYPPSSGQGLFD